MKLERHKDERMERENIFTFWSVSKWFHSSFRKKVFVSKQSFLFEWKWIREGEFELENLVIFHLECGRKESCDKNKMWKCWMCHFFVCSSSHFIVVDALPCARDCNCSCDYTGIEHFFRWFPLSCPATIVIDAIIEISTHPTETMLRPHNVVSFQLRERETREAIFIISNWMRRQLTGLREREREVKRAQQIQTNLNNKTIKILLIFHPEHFRTLSTTLDLTWPFTITAGFILGRKKSINTRERESFSLIKNLLQISLLTNYASEAENDENLFHP